MRCTSFIIVLLLSPVFIFSQIDVRKVSEDFQPSEGGGVFYMLPKTGFQFTVTVRQTMKIKGPYSDYASKYLGLEDVIESDKVSYSLLDVHMETFTIPDPEQLYYIVYDEKQSKDEKDIRLMFSGSGIFLGSEGINPAGLPEFPGYDDYGMPDRDSINRMFRFIAGENTFIKVDTIVRKISIDTMTIEDVSFKRSLSFRSDEQKAAEAAQQIEQIRSNQHNLLTGYQEVAYSEGSIRFMYGELRRMENEYLDLFRGKVIIRESRHYCTFIPGPDALDTWAPVFLFSEKNGFESKDEGNGQPVFIKIVPSGELSLLSSAIRKSGSTTAKSGNGFFARIPQLTDVFMRIDNNVYDVMKVFIPQYGEVVNIPRPFHNVSLHPALGNLKSATVKF